MQQQPSWIGVILVFAYFGFLIFWIPYASRRLEPRVRASVGRRLNVRIERGTGIDRGLNWQVSGRGRNEVGCQLFVWELATVVGLFLIPVLVPLLLLGALLLVASDMSR